MNMQYQITIKKSLDTVAKGSIVLCYEHDKSVFDDQHMDQDKLDQIVFDLESSFNARPDIRSNQYRVHIERGS